MSTLHRKHLWLGILLLTPALLQAQVSAEISGRVEDATGSAVGGVTVTVKSVETGATRSVVSDADGNFHVLSLPVGQQELKAEKTGFKSVVRTGINLAVGQEAVVNLQLEVGDLVQQVTVIAEAPLVNTTTSSVSGLVGEREIKDLPLNGRSFDNLIALNPGAISYGLKSPNTITSMGNTFSVSGKRPLDNIFLLNGVEYTGSSQLSVTPGGVSGELASHAGVDIGAIRHQVALAIRRRDQHVAHGLGGDVGDVERTGRPVALNQGHHLLLGVCRQIAGQALVLMLVGFLAADIGFVGFHELAFAAEGRLGARVHSLADAMGHEPRGLVRHAQGAVQLVSADAHLG